MFSMWAINPTYVMPKVFTSYELIISYSLRLFMAAICTMFQYFQLASGNYVMTHTSMKENRDQYKVIGSKVTSKSYM